MASFPFTSLKEFVEDYNQFRERIADLDRRLASIVCQGFDDCASTEAALKVRSKLQLDLTTVSSRISVWIV